MAVKKFGLSVTTGIFRELVPACCFGRNSFLKLTIINGDYLHVNLKDLLTHQTNILPSNSVVFNLPDAAPL